MSAKKAEKTKEKPKEKNGYEPRLFRFYHDKVVPELLKQYAYKNVMEVPRLVKIVLNMGVGSGVEDAKNVNNAAADLTIIGGQKPQITKAKKSISNFKLREGMAIGCRVTLRRWRMYEFLDRYINIAIPRVRDFRGMPDKAFDGRGNYSVGVREQIIFPEINYDKVDRIRGMNITFVTSAKTDEEAYSLLAAFGFPFRKR